MKTKKNIIIQLLLTLIPLGGLYAHYRIEKLGLGIAVGFLSTFIMIFPFVFGIVMEIDYSEIQLAVFTIVGMGAYLGIPYATLIKWTIDWNRSVDAQNISTDKSQSV